MDVLVNDTGMTVVYEPESGFPVVDIVVVHGLQGHPYKTWTCKGSRRDHKPAVTARVKADHRVNSSRGSYHRVGPLFSKRSSGSSSTRPKPGPGHREEPRHSGGAKETQVFWPQDLLPVQYPKARILVYGYDTRVTKYFVAPTNENSISSHGKDLLSSLAASREINRPLILIAHSLGGIVVKEMLASSYNSTEDRLRDIVASTAAVMFLGTPHRGSRALAKIGDRARNIIHAFGMKTNPAILDALRLKTHDLERAQESFSSVWSRYDFRVKTFQEGLGLTGLNLGPFGKKVVPNDSSLLGDVRERAETIQANHMDMCRFKGSDDPNYRRICGEITSIYDSIAGFKATPAPYVSSQSFTVSTLGMLRHKERGGTMDERERLLVQSLAFPNMNQRTQNLEPPADGTCSWLFKHEVFVNWLYHNRQSHHCGLIWIRGKPGSGKSTLLKEACTRAAEKTASQCDVASFFFNAEGNKLEHSPTGMLRSIIHQMCTRSPEILGALIDFSERRRAMNGEDTSPWEKAELSALFMEAVACHKKRAMVFIDAIDECDPDSARDVADFWRDITKTANSTAARLSVCLSSRHFPAIAVNDCPEIIMENHNHSDIVEFVRRRLDLGMSGKHLDQQAIQAKILEKSGGVFLWVSLVVKDVLQKHDEGKGMRFLLKHLDSVPQKLEDLFYELLTKGTFSTMVVKMFQWALLPRKPLRLHEWHHILAFIGDTPPSSLYQWQQSDSYTETDEQLEKRITHLSRGLLGFGNRSSGDDRHEAADESMSDRAGAGSLDLSSGETRVVQVIHESVRQYFMEGPGFAVLDPAFAERALAHAHVSMMNVCLDYILIEELDALVEARKLARLRLDRRPTMARVPSVESFESERPEFGPRLQLRRKNSFGSGRRKWHRSASVASFSSASSHGGIQTPDMRHWDTREREPKEMSLGSYLQSRENSAQDQDPAGSWLKDQSVEDQAYCDEKGTFSYPQSLATDCSQVLEAYPALLSYATFELFTHACKADVEGLDLSHVVKRLQGGAWDRWKALREDSDQRTELLYFVAFLGLSFWLNADHVWGEVSVSLSIENAIRSEDQEALGKLLDAFPLAAYRKEISGKILAFLVRAEDAAMLQLYLSRHLSEKHDSPNSATAMSDILESKDSDGRTALHLAVTQQHKTAVSVLLKHGADVSTVDYEQRTPLYAACYYPDVAIVQELLSQLLSRGVDPLARDHRGRTPLHMAALGSTPMVVQTLLLSPGILVDVKDDNGSTPLHVACNPRLISRQSEQLRLASIRELLAHGAKAYTIWNKDGDSPFDVARKFSFEWALEVLANESCDAPTRQVTEYKGSA